MKQFGECGFSLTISYAELLASLLIFLPAGAGAVSRSSGTEKEMAAWNPVRFLTETFVGHFERNAINSINKKNTCIVLLVDCLRLRHASRLRP